ncbi:hypothetical protein GQ600_20624 [Phytophthora cactorum]|nr:hypothetical protein GQ600_20624 [Phytophthora cactorum]
MLVRGISQLLRGHVVMDNPECTWIEEVRALLERSDKVWSINTFYFLRLDDTYDLYIWLVNALGPEERRHHVPQVVSVLKTKYRVVRLPATSQSRLPKQ